MNAEIGQHFTYESDGKPVRDGLCDRIETRVGKWRNALTGAMVAGESIRFRLRPISGRAFWTRWFPKRKGGGR